VKPVRVDVDFELHGNQRTMNRRLQSDGEREGAQRARLAEIAERTPVTLTLETGCIHRDDVRVDCAAPPRGPSDATSK
jgi:hypothetical protein